MQLSKQLVEKFQELHREKYGEEIGYDFAEAQLNELADLVRMTAQRESTKE